MDDEKTNKNGEILKNTKFKSSERITYYNIQKQKRASMHATLKHNNTVYDIYTIEGETSVQTGSQYRIGLVAKLADEAINELMDQKISVEIKNNTSKIKIYGYLSAIEEGRSVSPIFKEGSHHQSVQLLHVTLVDALDYLKQSRHSRIYHDKSSLEIINELLSEYKESFAFSVDVKLDTKKLQKSTYTCQYEQSDYDFIKMLAHKDGYTISVDSRQDNNLVILSDHKNRTKREEVPGDYQAYTMFENSHYLSQSYNTRNPSESLSYDINYANPDQSLISQAISQSLKRETYFSQEHPAPNHDNVQSSGQNQSQASYAHSQNFVVKSEVLDLNLGEEASFKPQDTNKYSKDGLIIKSEIQGYFKEVLKEYAYTHKQEEEGLHASYTLIPQSIQYKPKQLKVDKISGVMLARVQASQADTTNSIAIDEQGRVKVELFFGENSKTSCWLHYNDAFVGDGFGSRFIPRVNTEVAVSFIDGDINSPMIVGQFYNGNNTKTNPTKEGLKQSRIKTQTNPQYKEEAGYNEILFDDTKEQEQLNFKAQKSYKQNSKRKTNIHVKEDQKENIQQSYEQTILGDVNQVIGQTHLTKAGSLHSMKNHKSIQSQKNYEEHIQAKSEIRVGQDSKEIIEGNLVKKIQGYMRNYVAKDVKEKFLKELYENVTKDSSLSSQGISQLKAKSIHYQATTININASKGISFTAGGSTIELDSSGIHLNGAAVDTTKATAVTLTPPEIEALEMPEFHSLKVTAIEVDVSEQSELEEILTFKATVEKETDGEWAEVSSLEEYELLQLNWSFFKSDDEEAITGMTDDSITYDSLTISVATHKNNKLSFGFGHCVVGDEVVELVPVSLKRDVRITAVLGLDVITKDEEGNPSETDITYRADFDVEDVTSDELADFSTSIMSRDAQGKETTIELTLDESLELPFSFSKEDDLASIIVSVVHNDDEGNIAETITGII